MFFPLRQNFFLHINKNLIFFKQENSVISFLSSFYQNPKFLIENCSQISFFHFFFFFLIFDVILYFSIIDSYFVPGKPPPNPSPEQK